MISITDEQINRVESILNGVRNGPEKVFFNVINRALTTVRAEAGRQIRAVYAISQKDLRSESNIQLRKASRSNLAGEIAFSGCKIPLYRFNVSPKQPTFDESRTIPVKINGQWKRVNPSKPVKAAVLKSSAQTELEHAFIANMQNGHTGIFNRKELDDLLIRELKGPSIAHMADNSVVLAQVEKAAQETIDKRIDAEMNRILNGYGG